ncbi:MAG: cupredoxin domain-containing protein [Chloroflexota bacterium]|nr:cupredoxin domain-containing protein [Chloroflexota bacterium]
MLFSHVAPRAASRLLAPALAVAMIVAGFSAGTTAQTAEPPTGAPLTADELAELTAQFDDEVLIGGQVAPRISRWVNEEVFIFLQLNSSDLAEATEIRYAGIGVKGVFCAETQPDPSFTHFHKYDAPEYAAGHGSEPGDQGYWLTWAATDTFETRDGREVVPGIDYEFSPTPPPACGDDVPEVAFDPPGAEPLTEDEIAELIAVFDSPLLTGGQTPPRFHRWINEEVTIFLQFDSSDPAAATRLLDIGITVPGVFCLADQPSTDFPHFHQTDAPEYAAGHGSAPDQVGYWLLWVATDTYEARDGRQISPGVDRAFSPTPPPDCGNATPEAATGGTGTLTVTGAEYGFDPAEPRVGAGESVSLTFANAGTIPHTFTIPAVEVDTGSVAAGASTTVTFTAPDSAGSHEFLCTFGGHPELGMVGTLIVE